MALCKHEMENKIFKLFILNHDHALSKVNSSIMVSNCLATKQFSILSLHQSSKDWKGAVMKKSNQSENTDDWMSPEL